MKKNNNLLAILGVIGTIILVIIAAILSSASIILISIIGVVLFFLIMFIIGKNTKKKYGVPDLNLEWYEMKEPEDSFYDKGEWQYKSCQNIYCEKTGKTIEQLTKEDEDIIWRYACNHIGIFVTWLIKNDFFDEKDKEVIEDIKKVKEDKLLGVDLIIKDYDCTISENEIKSDILPFVKKYYNYYIGNYDYISENELGKETFSYIATIDDYYKYEKIIDNDYNLYKTKMNKGDKHE